MALLVLWFVFVFLAGCCVGSFINVCVARLPFEKSLIWPGSRCPKCFQAIRALDNVPVLSYFLLGGRCRTCQADIPWRYPLVELGTGLAFAGLFYLEMVANVLHLPMIDRQWGQAPGMVPLAALPVFLHHAVLLSFLIVVSLCDLSDMEIPLPITATGTVVGLVLSALLAWPFPELLPGPIPGPVPPVRWGPQPRAIPPVPGVYPWPVWWPLPDWLPPGSWQLGLATGLAGALAGMVLLRGVRFLFGVGRGVEGLGVGDADLMMMAGAFIGWQPVVLAFFVSVGPALVFALGQMILRGGQALPFGPSLAAGVMITILSWPKLSPPFAQAFFDPFVLAALGIGGGLGLLGISFLLRVARPDQGGGTAACGS
jgi:leader peptidase (prepilin peptidase)/N-methyltransferase